MESSLITIIVPVYNVEEYLVRCIESIVNQTYKNLEIILVDDGSVDKSGLICDDYASRDTRIVVIHKENSGQSAARNQALEIANGQYIAFVDSDDYVTDDYIEYMYSLLMKSSADVVMCGLKKVYTIEEVLDEYPECITEYDAREALENLLYQRQIIPSPCCKLYKRELFKEIRYPEGMYYEDLAVIYRILDLCNKVVVSKKQKYFYFQRKNSTMNLQFNLKKMQRIQVVNEMQEYIVQRYSELYTATEVRCFIAGVQVFREIPKDKKYNKYIEEVWEQIVRHRAITIKADKAKVSTRVMALSSYMGKAILGCLGRLYTVVFKHSV